MLKVLNTSWPLLLGVMLLMVGNGIQGTLLGIRGAIEGFSTFEISVVMSSYFAGFLFGSKAAPAMIRKVGHVRVFAALGSLISAVLVVYPVAPDWIVWSLLRVLIGFCFSGIYITAESWLNNAATNDTRGQALSAYMIVQMLGIIASQALLNVAGRETAQVSGFDLGFALGPRINAAGRLADMTLGIECLLTDDLGRADELAKQLDTINRERRVIESDMREMAMEIAASLLEEGETPPPALCVFDPDFHEGVVGIVASRLKDTHHRPTFVFAASTAPGKEHELKGSGRSIAGFHLRDALDLVAKRAPGVLLRFGGHAMAAGCTIAEEHFEVFEATLQQVALEWLDAATLQRRLETDGPLAPEYRRTELVDMLQREVWGQGFAAPVFSDEVDVLSQRLVGEKHLALKLKHQGQPVDGIWFNRVEPLPARVKLAYRLDADEWQGQKRVRFMVEAAEIL